MDDIQRLAEAAARFNELLAKAEPQLRQAYCEFQRAQYALLCDIEAGIAHTQRILNGTEEIQG